MAYLPSYMTFSSRRMKRSIGPFREIEDLFEGCLGLMPGEPYSFKLKPNEEPVHARPFRVPAT